MADLFAPRPPFIYIPPVDIAPGDRSTPKVSGVSQYLELLQDAKKNDNYQPTESWLQKQQREKKEKTEKNAIILKEAIEKCEFIFLFLFYIIH